MKQIFSFFLLAAVIASCTSTDKPSAVEKDKALQDTANYTTIQWLDSTEQNIGKVDEGQVVEISWHFKNAGNKPLVVANVRPGCGCTGAEGPVEPVAPGKESLIKAKFDSKNFQGIQHKQVYVKANNSNKNSTDQDILNFVVEVVPKK
jgi:hypothetical protein